MGEDLGPAIREDQRQFVRKPLPVVQDFRAVLFLLFPVVGEFHGTPMRNMAVFPFAEDPVEHSRRTEQANVSAMQGRKRPAANIAWLGKKDSTGLTVRRGIEQQILYFIQRNTCVRECDRSGWRYFVTNGWRVRQIRQIRLPS